MVRGGGGGNPSYRAYTVGHRHSPTNRRKTIRTPAGPTDRLARLRATRLQQVGQRGHCSHVNYVLPARLEREDVQCALFIDDISSPLALPLACPNLNLTIVWSWLS